MRRNPVKKGTLTYGEAYDALKKKREAQAQQQSSCSHDDDFDVSIGAMMGAMMATDDAPFADTICDTSTSCDISDTFDF